MKPSSNASRDASFEEAADYGGELPTTATSSDDEMQTFDEIELSDIMRESLVQAGYTKPSPVQAGVIPVALTGRDVLGQARTGTGKTASFAIPILETIDLEKRLASPQAIVLAPTRELAVQVRDEFEKLAHGRKVRSVALYGGKPIKSQITKLERGADVIIGTPGRVLDHLSRRTLDLSQLKFVVLDEADRMLDIGFRPDIEKILRSCPKNRQTLLLSATVAPGVRRLAERYMQKPEVLDFSPKSKSVDTIEQFYFTVEQSKKFELLVRLLAREKPEQAIVFCRTKRGTDKTQEKLSRKIEGVDCMHGDMAQTARDRTMKRFRAGEVKLLVATDVVGRGIDVSSISHIFNFDIPESSDDYVHRVGRTGRMGRDGVAYTFVTPEQGAELTRIEMLINKELKRGQMEGFDATATRVAAQAPREIKMYGSGAPAPKPAETSEEKPAAAPVKKAKKKHRRAL